MPGRARRRGVTSLQARERFLAIHTVLVTCVVFCLSFSYPLFFFLMFSEQVSPNEPESLCCWKRTIPQRSQRHCWAVAEMSGSQAEPWRPQCSHSRILEQQHLIRLLHRRAVCPASPVTMQTLRPLPPGGEKGGLFKCYDQE